MEEIKLYKLTDELPTKAEAEAVATKVLDIVSGGGASALQTLGLIKAYEQAFEIIKANIISLAMDEAEAAKAVSIRGGNTVTRYGAEFTLQEVGVKYDYANNTAKPKLAERWVKINNQIKELNEKRKVVETELKPTTSKYGMPSVVVKLRK